MSDPIKDELMNDWAAPQQNAEAAEDSVGMPPPGKYTVEIVGLRYKTMDTKKGLMLALEWDFTVCGGPEDERFFNHLDFYSDARLPYIKKNFRIAEIAGETPKEAEANFGAALGKQLRITVKQNGEYRNLYFNSLVQSSATSIPKYDDDAPAPTNTSSPLPDDDIDLDLDDKIPF